MKAETDHFTESGQEKIQQQRRTSFLLVNRFTEWYQAITREGKRETEDKENHR